MKKVIIILGVSLFSLTAIGQKKDVVKAKTDSVKITDSTAVISVNDVVQFNEFLKKNISYESYMKLTAEAVLTELIRWKFSKK